MLRMLFLIVAFAMVFAANSAKSEEPVTIRTSWVVVPTSIDPVIFAKPGLTRHANVTYKLEPLHFAGSAAQITALASGDLEVANLSPVVIGDMLVNGHINDLRIISNKIRDGAGDYYSNEFMVLKDGPVKAIEDLKGKVLASNAIGGGTDIGIRVLLRKHGLEDKRDYSIIETGFENMAAVLAQHKADLITAVPPFSYDPRLLSVARTLFTLKDALGTTDLTVSVARTGFIAQHRAALVDYLEDELRATRWFTDPANHDEAVGLLRNSTSSRPT